MTRGKSKLSRSGAGWWAIGGLPLALFLLFVGLPLGFLVARGLAQDDFFGYLTRPQVLQAVRLSFTTSTISLVIMVVVGTPLAYFLARHRFPGHRVVDTLIELPIILPPVVAGLAMLMAFGRVSPLGRALDGIGINLPFTVAAVIMAEIFVAAPFYIRAAKLGFEAVDPGLEELAQTLGASPWQSFRRVTLPLARRALIGGLVLAWARAISEFGATLMFAGNLPGRTQTMPLAVLAALESSLGATLALAVLMLAIAVLVLLAARLLLQRRWGELQTHE